MIFLVVILVCETHRTRILLRQRHRSRQVLKAGRSMLLPEPGAARPSKRPAISQLVRSKDFHTYVSKSGVTVEPKSSEKIQ
jgi:hypothetical protein